LSSELLFDEAATAKFFKDFDFNENNGTYRIKFFDLGLSETLDENEFGSSSKSGTPVYSSPEQLRGGFQTPNSDMWSIGVIYYRILTGRLPFMG
jgi:serine/threonine protein kinase